MSDSTIGAAAMTFRICFNIVVSPQVAAFVIGSNGPD
jgi:hypothetical protein